MLHLTRVHSHFPLAVTAPRLVQPVDRVEEALVNNAQQNTVYWEDQDRAPHYAITPVPPGFACGDYMVR